MTEGCRRERLPGGIRLVTEHMPHVRSVAVGVWLESGSRHESDDRAGISHLIEHLVFKGTATRSAEDIARTMDSVGGQMDAFTTKEYTGFYVQVLDEHLPLAVELLTDILRNPRFDPEELEREKSVVLQEIKMVEDTPDDLVHDLFAAEVWAGHALRRPILGGRDAVAGYGADTVRGYFEGHYVPGRIVVAVAGNVSHARATELLGAGFGGFDRPGGALDLTPPVMHPGVHITAKTLEQVHLVLGFPGLAHAADERYALLVLNDVLGGSMSSRLFQEVRERQGLVYSIHSGLQSFADTGLLYVYAATDPSNFSKMLRSVLREIRRLRKEGVDAAGLERAKQHLKGSLLLSLESTSSRMGRLAKQEMHHGAYMSIDDTLGAIDRVGPDELRELVDRLLDESRLALTAYGPMDRRNLPRELLDR